MFCVTFLILLAIARSQEPVPPSGDNCDCSGAPPPDQQSGDQGGNDDCMAQHCSTEFEDCSSNGGCMSVLQEFMSSNVCEQHDPSTMMSQCYSTEFQLGYCSQFTNSEIDSQSCFHDISSLAQCHASNCEEVPENECIHTECGSQVYDCMNHPGCMEALNRAENECHESCDFNALCDAEPGCYSLISSLGTCYFDHCEMQEEQSGSEPPPPKRHSIARMMKNRRSEKAQLSRIHAIVRKHKNKLRQRQRQRPRAQQRRFSNLRQKPRTWPRRH